MKPEKWILTVVIAATLFSIVGFMWQSERSVPVESARVVLRTIGHRLLLHDGDSSSLILPVKSPRENAYQISFEKHLSIHPDSLVVIVRDGLKNTRLPKNYIVEVTACEAGEIAYSYEMAKSVEKQMIPCMGRVLPRDCYRVNIIFPEKGGIGQAGGFIPLAIGLLGAVFLFTFSQRTKKTRSGSAALPLGRFTFFTGENKLEIAGQTIPLTAREAEILELFCQQPNEIVTREQLMKEIWLDKGVVVGRSLDVFISKLRKKLEADPGVQIVNIHGLGYRLEVN